MPDDSTQPSSGDTTFLSSNHPLSPEELLNQLRQEREANQKTLQEMRKLSEENMRIATRVAMGGTASAGQVPPKEKTIDDVAQEMADATIKRMFARS